MSSETILSYKLDSAVRYEKYWHWRRVLLRRMPLANVNAAHALIVQSICCNIPLVLSIPSAESGMHDRNLQVVISALKAHDQDPPSKSGNVHFSGVTHSVGRGAYEVVFEFEEGIGFFVIQPFEDGGL